MDFLIIFLCVILATVLSCLISIGILGTLKIIFIGSYIILNIFVIGLFIRDVRDYRSDVQYFKVKKYHIVLPITCPIAFIMFLLIILAYYIIKSLIKLILIIINWSKKPLINRENRKLK